MTSTRLARIFVGVGFWLVAAVIGGFGYKMGQAYLDIVNTPEFNGSNLNQQVTVLGSAGSNTIFRTPFGGEEAIFFTSEIETNNKLSIKKNRNTWKTIHSESSKSAIFIITSSGRKIEVDPNSADLFFDFDHEFRYLGEQKRGKNVTLTQTQIDYLKRYKADTNLGFFNQTQVREKIIRSRDPLVAIGKLSRRSDGQLVFEDEVILSQRSKSELLRTKRIETLILFIISGAFAAVGSVLFLIGVIRRRPAHPFRNLTPESTPRSFSLHGQPTSKPARSIELSDWKAPKL